MQTTIVLLLVALWASPSIPMGAASSSVCGDGDVCEAIVYNQLALAEIREEMKVLLAAYNKTKEKEDLVSRSALSACEIRKDELMNQVSSLEAKYQATMVRDEGTNDELKDLRMELDAMRDSQEELQGENARLLAEISLQEEMIRNLSLLSYKPVDCADIQIQGQTESGVYTIYPYQSDVSIEVVCDLESEEGGWTVFLNRQVQAEPLDFNESWESFKNGFGNVNTEYWLGNDFLHVLTSRPSTLRVDAEDFEGDKRWGQWDSFSVDSHEKKYQVTFDQYVPTSTLGDSLTANSGSYFTTHDSDNDKQEVLNCAVGSRHSLWGKGGWWYSACGTARPTGPLANTKYWNSACWQWFNKESNAVASLKTLSMKFRRVNYEQLAAAPPDQ